MRRLRSIAGTWVLVTYGAISLLGPGLHSAPGIGHAFTDSFGHLALVDGHHHATGAGSDHCSVCHFFTQGQLASDYPDIVCVYQSRLSSHEHTSTISLASDYTPSQPRAPPSALGRQIVEAA
jgi:hypothetical protein